MEKPSLPTPFQKSICWLALSGLALVVVISLIIGLVLGLGYLFVALEAILLPLIIAGILAYLLSPCVQFVQRFIKKRVAAVLTVLGTATLLLAGLGTMIVPPLIKQINDMVDKREAIYDKSVEITKDLLQNSMVQKGVDVLYEKTKPELAGNTSTPEEQEITHQEKLSAVLDFHSSYMIEKGIQWLPKGTQALMGIITFIIGAVMIPVFLFYFLWESESIVKNWHTILPLRRSHFRMEVVDTLQEINGYIVSFVRGQVLVSLIDAILIGTALKILGLPYALTIAAVAAIIGIIPYIGMILTSIPAILIAWSTLGSNSALIVAAIFICVSQFDGWIIQPRIIGNRVKMHEFTIMFSVLFWGIVFGGVVGALIAIPLTASLKVIFTRYIWTSFKKKQEETPSEASTSS